MRTVRLAGIALSSSRLGFGLSNLHHIVRSSGRQTVLSAAFDDGITYFDSSPYYGHGLAEQALGVFSTRRRHQILVATKFGIEPDPWMERFPGLMYPCLAANAALRRITGHDVLIKRRRDYSGSNAVRSLHRSLRALRTDHVDLLYLHEPTLSLLRDPGRMVETLESLKTSGKVRYFGLAGNAGECVEIARRYPALGTLIQVNAATGGAELNLLRAAGIPFQVTFGHFRDRSGTIDESLASAVAMNADGVILFSSRRPERVRAVARLLAALDIA